MEIKELTQTEQKLQHVDLVKGDFTRMEASHIIGALIDQKINFHKIQRLQHWEGNHGCETRDLDGRIAELEEQKRLAKEFLSKQNQSGCVFNIKGTLEIQVKQPAYSTNNHSAN